MAGSLDIKDIANTERPKWVDETEAPTMEEIAQNPALMQGLTTKQLEKILWQQGMHTPTKVWGR